MLANTPDSVLRYVKRRPQRDTRLRIRMCSYTIQNLLYPSERPCSALVRYVRDVPVGARPIAKL